jgi:hypothetical protein
MGPFGSIIIHTYKKHGWHYNSNNASHISKLNKKSVFFRVEKNKQAKEMAQSKY